jgi:nucleoside-diphosphate-sugar epimerase
VTGAAGFVGRWTLRALVQHGWQVHAVGRRDPEVTGVTFHPVDLLAPDAPGRVRALRASHLLHAAWDVTHGAYWTSPSNLAWLAASLRLVEAFVEGSGRRVVGVGTCAEYKWGSNEPLAEVAPLRPSTLYGTAKDAMRRVLEAFARTAACSWAWARLFHVFGPGEHPERFVPQILRGLRRGERIPLGGGEQIRDFMFVGDAGDALARLAVSTIEGPVNVASGDPVRLADFAGRLAALAGRSDLLDFGALPTRPDDPVVLVADVSRLRTELAYVAPYGIERGIRATYDGAVEAERA